MVLKDDSNLPKLLAKKLVNLCGTRLFWQNKSRELEALVWDQNANFFAIASPVDMQWSDLYYHMRNRELADGATEEERRRLNFWLLQENPHIVATYLYCRWNLFFEHILKQIFDINDHWVWYELQVQGSGHIHGLYWTKESLKVDELEKYLLYWGKLVLAKNSDGRLSLNPVHLCSRPFGTLHNNRQELTEVVNCCQWHTKCNQAYCLWKQKDTNETICKFNLSQILRKSLMWLMRLIQVGKVNFSQPLWEKPDVNNESNLCYQTFALARNDPLLNNYNPAVTMGWLANIDVIPCTNRKVVLYYVAKYCTKAKIKTVKLDELMKDLLLHISSKNAMGLLVMKFLNKLIRERDISVQQAWHLLLQLDLTSLSRLIGNMDVWLLEMLTCALLFINKGDSMPKDTYLERYCSCDKKLEARTLYEMYTLYNWSPKLVFTMQTWGKPIVLNIYLLYLSDPEHHDYKQFWIVKMMVHHSFKSKDLDDLFVLEDDSLAANWQLVYEKCLTHHSLYLVDALGVY